MATTESAYQKGLAQRVEARFPGCEIIRGDPQKKQGQLDWIILFAQGVWAKLEIKRSATASHRPNQQYYVDDANSKSFAAFIYPENEDEVLDAIQSTLRL